jgi:hypothetical protein
MAINQESIDEPHDEPPIDEPHDDGKPPIEEPLIDEPPVDDLPIDMVKAPDKPYEPAEAPPLKRNEAQEAIDIAAPVPGKA